MKQRQILIGIRTEQEQADEVKGAWRRAEKGLSPKEPIDRLYFLDMASLMKVLSPKRMELLKALRSIGFTNIRQLALKLGRNYSNVYQDVTELSAVGLIEMPKKNRYGVPWDLITIDIGSGHFDKQQRKTAG
jgi:predicted transcriptional regulator